MIDTRLIMLEGLPGTGKTTNSAFLRIQLERGGYKVKWFHEVASPHPTSFFIEAVFTYEEYDAFLKKYPEAAHILNNIAVFRKNTVGIDLIEIEWNYLNSIGDSVFQALKRFDAWNFTLGKYKEIALEKWTYFVEKALNNKNSKDEIYIIDSSIFQFQIFAFLFVNAPYEDLEKFVKMLIDIIRPLNPYLIYFYRENTEETIDYLENDRGTGFFEWAWERDKLQPYYRDKPKGTEGFKQFLRDYADFANKLFDIINLKKLSVEITDGDWKRYEKEMLSFLGIEYISSPNILPKNGVYRNDKLNLEIIIDGLTMKDPFGNVRKLIPKSDAEFYIDCLPMILRFEEEQITVKGVQIPDRWTKTGTAYKLKVESS